MGKERTVTTGTRAGIGRGKDEESRRGEREEELECRK